MERSLDGLAGHPKRIANHLTGKALPFVLPLLLVEVFLLAIFTV